jgi:hypothetical protein
MAVILPQSKGQLGPSDGRKQGRIPRPCLYLDFRSVACSCDRMHLGWLRASRLESLVIAVLQTNTVRVR